MKKFKFLIFGLLLLPILHGQEIVETIDPPIVAEEIYYEDQGTVYPTPSKEEIGPLHFEKRNLDPEFKEDYKGKKFAYDRVVKQKTYSPPAFSLTTGLFQVLMYIMLAVIILVVIYQIIKNAGGFSFGGERKKIKFDTSEEKHSEDTEDIANNDFKSLIEQAKSDKDFRKAIRYYHLWVLQTLSDKKLIRWNKDKTDYDYYRELGENPVKNDFSDSVYVYDYIWYGNFQINPKEFDIAESIFQRMLSKLR